MVELLEALATERARRQHEASEADTRQELRKVVLGALAERLNESRIANWLFQIEGDQLKIFFGGLGSHSEIAAWKLDDQTRLVLGNDTTEWITGESFTRVIDQAVQMTAKVIVDVETADRNSAGIVELPPRY